MVRPSGGARCRPNRSFVRPSWMARAWLFLLAAASCTPARTGRSTPSSTPTLPSVPVDLPNTPALSVIAAEAPLATSVRPACPSEGPVSPAVMPPGRYAATIDQRSAGCCSESCGARSTVSTIAIDLRPDRTAEAQWSRKGCNLTVSASRPAAGGPPLVMPNDPAPEWLCALPDPASVAGEHRELIDLNSAGRLTGTWARECDGVRLALSAPREGTPWSLQCTATGTAGPDQAPFTCTTTAGRWSESVDLAVDGRLLLDARPGFQVRVRVPGFGASTQVEIVRPSL